MLPDMESIPPMQSAVRLRGRRSWLKMVLSMLPGSVPHHCQGQIGISPMESDNSRQSKSKRTLPPNQKMYFGAAFCMIYWFIGLSPA